MDLFTGGIMDLSQHDVIIVGAGPTGLALGLKLQGLGISPLILDSLDAGVNTSRAAVIHARTLEVLEPVGVTPELLQNGVIVPTFRVRDRDRILATISFKDLDTPYPFTLMCPQDRTESILLGRLEALGGVVRRPAQVLLIRSAQDVVEVQFKTGEALKTARGKWLVGCDGTHSVVRQQASIPFEGDAYEEDFILADVEMDWPLDRDEVSLFFSERGLVVVAPLPGNHFRIVATMQNAPATPSIPDFQQILNERGPESATAPIRRMVWSSRFHIHHRVAKFLRKGNVLLAGDAAHVHSPAGGQGMNTGIQDAVSLGGALHRVLKDGDEGVLEEWQEERLKIARSVVSLTDRMTKMATASSPIVKRLRNAVIGIVGHVPFAEHALAEKLAELDNK
jgi:2-polyprenyl-6-methoxyphenol hydroxylase-like FAD-dependent oxidoreductase